MKQFPDWSTIDCRGITRTQVFMRYICSESSTLTSQILLYMMIESCAVVMKHAVVLVLSNESVITFMWISNSSHQNLQRTAHHAKYIRMKP